MISVVPGETALRKSSRNSGAMVTCFTSALISGARALPKLEVDVQSRSPLESTLSRAE